MSDILLTHSYLLRLDPKEFKALMPYPPLGTLYAAAVLRSQGYTVSLFDSMLASHEAEIIPVLDRLRPRFLVIYDDDFNYLTKMCLSRMRDAAYTMSRLAADRGIRVIVHGSDPTDHAEGYLRNGAEAVILGEGEYTLGELLDRLAQNHAVDTIPGLAFLSKNGIVRTPRRTITTDLDAIPFPARDLVDMEAYARLWRKRHGYFSTNMVTTRGCPYHCNWCAKPIYGQVYHTRSPQNVVEEMHRLKSEFAPDHIWFCDDIFGLTPGWIAAFAEEVSRKRAQIPFKCLSRADLLLHDGTITALRRAGCSTVWLGAESGSQKILDAMEKGTTVEQIRRSAGELRAHGITVGFFLQFGYPGETMADIELTLTMLRECKPDEIGISVSYPLPGTKFFENVKSQLGEKQNWFDSQDLAMMYRGTYSPAFYRTLHKLTHKKFRMWQGAETLKRAFARPNRLSAGVVRRIAASAYHAATIPALALRLNRLSREPAPRHDPL